MQNEKDKHFIIDIVYKKHCLLISQNQIDFDSFMFNLLILEISFFYSFLIDFIYN